MPPATVAFRRGPEKRPVARGSTKRVLAGLGERWWEGMRKEPREGHTNADSTWDGDWREGRGDVDRAIEGELEARRTGIAALREGGEENGCQEDE